MVVEVKIDGGKELMALFNRAAKVAPGRTRKVTQQLAERGKNEARKQAPVDTWFMHDHIRTFHGKDTSDIHSQATYSGFVNFGTIYQAPQPFFTFMVEDLARWMPEAYEKVLEEALK